MKTTAKVDLISDLCASLLRAKSLFLRMLILSLAYLCSRNLC